MQKKVKKFEGMCTQKGELGLAETHFARRAAQAGATKAMKKVLHMIGNAHIDPVWLWRWQDGYSEVRATFRSALDRMEEYPDFVFTSAAAAYYQWIEQSDPEMFEEIRRRVREGRWRIVGGWWIQADCNIPGGEGFARQALYAQRYFYEKFGVTARTGYNVDSFGHSGSLPKILRQCGMDRYVYMRPGHHEKSYPAWTFLWQSPEGEAVTAFRIPFEYCTWGKELSAHIGRVAQEIRDENGMMCFYGVGNHGGGPTRENLDSIAALNGQGGVELRLSDPDAFFDSLTVRELPVVNGDLLHHASGCYAGHSLVKRLNRRAEHRLLTAEKWRAAAYALLGLPYPAQDFERAWKKVLFNQFHDILAGCCIREAYEDAKEDFGFALSVAGEQMNAAQQALMRRMDIPFEEGALHYVAFNPHGFAAKAPVALEVAGPRQPMRLTDSEGHEIAYQLAPGSAAANGRRSLRFVAEVPAMGWQVYTMRPAPQEQLPQEADAAPAPESEINLALTLENEEIAAVFDEKQGLCGLTLKRTQTQLLKGAVQAVVIDDPSDTWSHAVLRFDRVEGTLPVREVRVVADGPAYKTVRVVYADDDSTLTQDYTLWQGVGQVFVHNRLEWRKRQKLLKLRLPLSLRYCRVCAQAPFGYADRLMDGVEYPMHAYVDATGVAPGQEQPVTGLAVLNDGKYAYSAEKGALDITLVRSPYYANHEPFVVEPGMDYPTVDYGEQAFTLSLMPHEGALQESRAEEAALLLNAPVALLAEGAHGGPLARRGSFLALDACHAVIDAVKLAEDGSGALIVHLHETARREETATLRLPQLNMAWPVSLRPGQIKALRIRLPEGTIAETNLIEMDGVQPGTRADG